MNAAATARARPISRHLKHAVEPFRSLVRPAPLEYVLLAVGLALSLRYLWILDDSFIYYRYVDNLLFLDRGLVFNQGEYVEGYSSPLWLLVLIAARSTHLDYWTIVAAIAAFSSLAFGYVCIVINRALTGDAPGVPVDLPLALLTTAYSVASYFSSGSESPLMQLAAGVVALHAVAPRWKAMQFFVGLLPLVRNEFAVPLTVAVVGSWILYRRFPWAMVASAAVSGTGWLVFRISYYAEFFPTPFYLKDKTAVAQGLHYLKNCVQPYGLDIFLALTAVALIGLWYSGDRALKLRSRGLMWMVALSSVPYVVRVGGDMMHYRLLAFPFCLVTLSMGGIAERFLSTAVPSHRALAGSALTVSVATVCLVRYPSFLSSHPLLGHEERQLDQGISDAPWHRHHPALRFTATRWQEDRAQLRAYQSTATMPRIYATEVFCATMFRGMNTQYVHGYGLTEPILARMTMPEERPGHKSGLFQPASQLARLRSRFPDLKRGLAAHAAEHNGAPRWIQRNLEKIRIVENKMYNVHDFAENLRLAFGKIGVISPKD